MLRQEVIDYIVEELKKGKLTPEDENIFRAIQEYEQYGSKKKTLKEIAVKYGIGKSTISNKKKQFEKMQAEGIDYHERIIGNSNLTEKQKDEIVLIITEKFPIVYAFNDINWTGTNVKTLIARLYGVDLGIRACQRLIRDNINYSDMQNVFDKIVKDFDKWNNSIWYCANFQLKRPFYITPEGKTIIDYNIENVFVAFNNNGNEVKVEFFRKADVTSIERLIKEISYGYKQVLLIIPLTVNSKDLIKNLNGINRNKVKIILRPNIIRDNPVLKLAVDDMIAEWDIYKKTHSIRSSKEARSYIKRTIEQLLN